MRDGHVEPHEGTGDRGLRLLRAGGVAVTLGVVPCAGAPRWSCVATGDDVDDEEEDDDEVMVETAEGTALAELRLTVRDALLLSQTSAALNELSDKRARAGDRRGYRSVCGRKSKSLAETGLVIMSDDEATRFNAGLGILRRSPSADGRRAWAGEPDKEPAAAEAGRAGGGVGWTD